MKLNLGCGSNKIKGYINIDCEKSCKPDKVWNFIKKPLPFRKNSVKEILFFHTIEHIRKIYHKQLLLDFHRVLAPGGHLYISYPNFWECAQRWHDNTAGQRTFWEATIYGRQLYGSDFHVCAIDPNELTFMLTEAGFIDIKTNPECLEEFNSITVAVKSNHQFVEYEKILANDDIKLLQKTYAEVMRGK